MALFLSTYVNKIDKKGRVSIPAPFRNALLGENFQGVVAYSSFTNPCIEACSMSRIEQLSESIDQLDPFSDERDAFATAILGGSVQMPFDGDGRVMLPAALLGDVNLSDKAVFVGKGATFEIWNEHAFADYAESARKFAKDQRSKLSLRKKNEGGQA